MATGVIGLGILLVIVGFLIFGHRSRRNDANPVFALGVGDIKQVLALRHSDADEAFLTVVFPALGTLDRERVTEYRFRQLETDAMVTLIGLGLSDVPFELHLDHTTEFP